MAQDWIAIRFAVLCADSKGRVRGGRVVCDHAVRVALLLDLTLLGRLHSGLDQNFVDTSPTGFGAADAILDYVEAHPGGSVAALIARAPVTVLDVLRPSADGRSARGRSMPVTLDPAVVAETRSVVELAADTGSADSVETAVLAVLAGALAFVSSDQRDRLLSSCGPVRGLAADCATYLDLLMDKAAMVSMPNSGAG